MEFPEDLRYTKEHEWARDEGSNRVRVGITVAPPGPGAGTKARAVGSR